MTNNMITGSKQVDIPFSLQDIENILCDGSRIGDGYLVLVYENLSGVYVLKMVKTDDSRYSPEEGASCICCCRVRDLTQAESYYKKQL